MKPIIKSSAIIIAAIVLGWFFYCAQRPADTVRVVGYASGEYDSDILRWTLTISAQTPAGQNLVEGYKLLNTDMKRFSAFLKKKGFNEKDFRANPAYTYPMYNNNSQVTSNYFEQTFVFTLRDVNRFDEIETLATDLTELLATGMNYRSSSLEYYISALPDLKKQIIGEAAKDALDRAKTVVESSGSKLGKLRYGRVGVFQITEPLSVEVESYGIYNTYSRRKQISVTMTSEFRVK